MASTKVGAVQALPNIWVPNGLANFLEKGLGSPVDVWLDDRKLLAVRLENGKTYIGKHPYASWGVVVAFIFFGLITLPIFFGLVFLYQAAKIYGDLKRQNAIIQELPDAIQV